MVPPCSDRISRVPPYSRTCSCFLPVRGCHPLWPAFPDAFRFLRSQATGLVRVRSPLLAESRLMSFPPATEMFQFAGFASPTYGFSQTIPITGGFPHSEIPGSTGARPSPRLFAACHVLHRLSVPRHPPNALIALDPSSPAARREQTAPCTIAMPRLRHTQHSFSYPPGRRSRRLSLETLAHGQSTRATRPVTQSYPQCQRSDARDPDVRNQSPDRRSPAQSVRFRNRSASAALVELNGIEPTTSCLQSRRSPN